MATVSNTAEFGRARGETAIGRMLRALRIWRDYRDTSHDLKRLSRRELADIGVDGDVEGFALRLAERRR